MQPIITILARAGSKGLPNKHLLQFNGKPLIEWTIELAAQIAAWGKHKDLYGCDVVVGSDSMQILGIAEKYNAIPFLRSEQFANDTAGKVAAIREVLQFYEKRNKKVCDLVVDLDATNPCRRLEDIDNSFKIFEEKRPKTLFSVTKAKKNPYFNQIEWDHEWGQYDMSKYIITPDILTRQDAPEVFDVNSNIYIYDAEWLRNPVNKSVITDKSEIYLMPEWTRHDIDSEYDFFDCENNFRKYILEEEEC